VHPAADLLASRIVEQGPRSPGGGQNGPSSSPWLLLPSAQEADSRAREAVCADIYRRYRPRVSQFFASRGFGPDDRRDLTQEVFLRVFRETKEFASRDCFESWLITIAANLRLNTRRDELAAKRHGKASSLDDLLSDKVNPGRLERRAKEETSVPAEQFEETLHAERRERLKTAVAELPPRMQRCVWLRVYQRRSFEEIGRLLRIEPDTVKAHVHQAQQRLRKTLSSVFADVEL
jgi:RNA polymerase sigma-70 factor (ECF subfamily)